MRSKLDTNELADNYRGVRWQGWETAIVASRQNGDGSLDFDYKCKMAH